MFNIFPLLVFPLLIGAASFFAMGSSMSWKRAIIAVLAGQIVGIGVVVSLVIIALEPNAPPFGFVIPLPFAIIGTIIGMIRNRRMAL